MQSVKDNVTSLKKENGEMTDIGSRDSKHAITIGSLHSSSDGTIYRIVSNIAILIHIVAYLYRDNYHSNEVDIPHNSAIRPWFILAIIKLV